MFSLWFQSCCVTGWLKCFNSCGRGGVENITGSSFKFFFTFLERDFVIIFICVTKCVSGQVHATDYSNASATGIFDSYQVWCMACLFTVCFCFWCVFLFFFIHISAMWLVLQMCWSGFISTLVSLPLSIFPKVENTGWVNHFLQIQYNTWLWD